MFGNFTEDARNIIVTAKEEMSKLKHPYIGSEHLLLAILKNDNNVSKRLKDFNVTYDNVKKEIINIIGLGSKESEWFLYTPMLRRIIENAIVDSKDSSNGEVTINSLFISLLDEGEGIAIRILLGMNIDIDELYKEFYNVRQEKKKKAKKLTLDDFGIDLVKKASNNEIDPVIGREKEINRVIEILMRRTKNNPILIGEPGVGKTAIVEELSSRIYNKKVPDCLKNKRIVSVDMASTVAGTKYRGEFEERIKKILKEVEENDDVILFIDEIHTLIGAGGAEGAIDASNIFKPALARNKLKCIGATTIDEYKKFIEKDGALERRFQKVFIEAPDKVQTKEILKKLKPIYEAYHMVSITDDIIELIVELSDKYIFDRKEPDKSIDILDEVCAKTSLKESKLTKEFNNVFNELNLLKSKKNKLILEDKFEEAKKIKNEEMICQNKLNKLELKKIKKKDSPRVLKEDVAQTISNRTKLPIYELVSDTNKSITDFEKKIRKTICGQKYAIDKIVKITKRIKLGYKDENKCYSFMFSGSSGVGKTFLANLFGEYLVGKDNIIKLDMSEYKESSSISKLVGAPPGYVGYEDNHNVFEEIRNKPNSVLILDEIDKAHPSIINLLYQILDESKAKDSKGHDILFNNVIIIMTSNIGFENESIGFIKEKSKVISKQKDLFSNSFINRIDDTIIFNQLEYDDIKEIVNKKIMNLKEKYLKKNITCIINNSVINEIINKTNFKEFGARKVDKIIRDDLENIIIEELLNGKYQINIKTLNDYTLV